MTHLRYYTKAQCTARMLVLIVCRPILAGLDRIFVFVALKKESKSILFSHLLIIPEPHTVTHNIGMHR